ncbi:MAG: hypothetical protein IJY23_06465 [Clostridia bacterium]|nr:hypothetical protein [Clostridia bacterium]
MTPEEELLKKRLLELSRKSEGGYYLFSDFLGLSEQSVFAEIKNAIPKGGFTLFGGADGCERIMVRFGNPEELGYVEDFPIRIVKIEPKSKKFAEILTHRDFLGSILNLGIERKTLGDIVIIDNVGYIFAKDEVASYIADSIETVRRTDVKAQIITELPEGELFKLSRIKIQLSGERLDAVISKVYSISRDDSLSLFKKRLVFVSGRLLENNSYTPKTDDVISVRGYGRFIYRGVSSLSKKGKLNADIDVYV